MEWDVILIRYGEIGLKSRRIRRIFENKLINNIKAAVDGRIRKERGRIFLYPENFGDAIEKLKKIFGIVSFSPCYEVSPDLDSITNKVLEIAKKYLNDGDSFRIVARRSNGHDFTSVDVAKRCGAEILRKFKEKNLKVDLKKGKPIYVEVRRNKAYIFTEIIEGLKGLPLGTQGCVVGLLSGGIDSPVAIFLMMKRGCSVVPVFFDSRPYISDAYVERAKNVYKKLKEYSIGEEFELIIFPYGRITEFIVKNIPSKYVCVFCKRGMLKIAEEIARRKNCLGIVTGENLGQVASQTLSNMLSITSATKLPVFRPLLTYDKDEIMALARKISTYEISAVDAGSCEALPDRVATKSFIDEVLKIEKESGFNKVVKEEVEKFFEGG